MASDATTLGQSIKKRSPAAPPDSIHAETPQQITIREGVCRFAAALIDADEEQRTRVAKHILSQCILDVQSLIIGRLVEIVKDDGGVAGAALASLAPFGKRALVALNYELVESRSGVVQLRFVRALATVTQKLPIDECVDLMFDLLIAHRLAADGEVRASIEKLLARLRRRQ
jgi:hypothetical protein